MMKFKNQNSVNGQQRKNKQDGVLNYPKAIAQAKQSIPKNRLKIFDIEEVHLLLERQEQRSALRPLLTTLLDEDNCLPLATVTRKLIKDVAELRKKFPNFDVVIDRCVKSLALSMLQRPATISIPPILLVGEPGVGKTRFLTELSETLQVDFYKCDLSTTSAGFILSGASIVWGDGRPGIITDSLRKSKTANFIMLLDEIDKASGDSRYDPLGCLHSLLEKKEAAKFIDEALQIKMNCSAINWFASANYIEQIPAPIRSRFSIFKIENPTPEQQYLIAQSVYKDLLQDNSWGHKFEKNLNNAVIEKLTALPARKQKETLLAACSEVAYRHLVEPNKLLKIGVDDIKILDEIEKKRAIGFY